MSLFSELKRRNVFKVASVYLVTSWIILQVVSVIAPALHLPTLFSTIFTVVLVMGFPVACIFAWAFELTPEGLKYSHEVDTSESIRDETGTKINYFLGIALLLALSFITYEKWFVAGANDNLERSIAVLPFEDMSPDKSQGYFGDGISEEILNSLARLKELVVIARTSSFNFKDTNTDIRDIGRILNVNYVLEGSVRKDKDQLRITAQLIEVESGKHIWSQTYDRTLDGIFAIQDELTYAITQALKLNLLPEQVNHEAGMTNNPEAYELFVQGRELAYQRTSSAIQKSATLLKKAISMDNNFYLAKTQLFLTYNLAQEYGGFDSTIIAAEKEALFWQLLTAPDFAHKYFVLADYAFSKNKYDVYSVLSEKAYQAAPNDPYIQNGYLLFTEDPQQAIKQRRAILRTNPQSAINYSNLIHLLVAEKEVDEAKRLLDEMVVLFPDTSTLLTSQLIVYFSTEHQFEKSLRLYNSYSGELSGSLRAAEATLLLYTNQVDKALSLLQTNFTADPTQFDFDFVSSLLLLQMRDQKLLTQEQQSKLGQLFDSNQQEILDIWLALLNGSIELFVNKYNLTNPTKELLQKSVKDNQLEMMMYLAIKKRQGETEAIDILLPEIARARGFGCRNNVVQRTGWYCQLYWHLVEPDKIELNFQRFEKQLSHLSIYDSSITPLLFNSPVYDGVRQHPDFEPTVQKFLDKTFRQTNPNLVFELH